MSGGVVINIPNLDRNMIPFIPFDNNDFPKTLYDRVHRARKLVNDEADGGYLSIKIALASDKNYHIVTAVVKPFVELLEEVYVRKTIKPYDQPTTYLMLASKICFMIRDAKICPYDEYLNYMIRLAVLLKQFKPSLMEAGMDQIIARLNYLMLFESEVRIWDYYALWVEDFGTMDLNGMEKAEVIEW